MTNEVALASMLDDLDHRPIIIDSEDLHSACCNTPAVKELGIESMADPVGGEIHRDESGRASGLLSEAAAVTLDWPYHIIHLRKTIRRTATFLLKLACQVDHHCARMTSSSDKYEHYDRMGNWELKC